MIDYRVSTLPTLFGEKVVLRILDKGNLNLDLTTFGIEPRAEREIMDAIANPYGMLLVTGPTGSGKTTTLYSALSKVNSSRRQHHDRGRSRRVQSLRHHAELIGRRARLRAVLGLHGPRADASPSPTAFRGPTPPSPGDRAAAGGRDPG